MRLADYLSEHEISDEDFAERIGVSRPTVSRLRRTGQKPSQATIEAIVEATDGAVTANDFWLSEAA